MTPLSACKRMTHSPIKPAHAWLGAMVRQFAASGDAGAMPTHTCSRRSMACMTAFGQTLFDV